MGQLTVLQKLSLKGNQPSNLPESNGQLTAWQSWASTLGAPGPIRARVPEPAQQPAGEHGQLTALHKAGLDGYQLNSLPERIGQLTALPRLGLKGNQPTACRR